MKGWDEEQPPQVETISEQGLPDASPRLPRLFHAAAAS